MHVAIKSLTVHLPHAAERALGVVPLTPHPPRLGAFFRSRLTARVVVGQRSEGSCSTTPGEHYYVPRILLSNNFKHDVRARLHAAPCATATTLRRLACLAGIFQNTGVYGRDLGFPHSPCKFQHCTRRYVRQERREKPCSQSILRLPLAKPLAANCVAAGDNASRRPPVRVGRRWGKGVDESGNGSSGHVLRAASEHSLYCLLHPGPLTSCVFCAYHRVPSHKPLHPHPHLTTAVLFSSDDGYCM